MLTSMKVKDGDSEVEGVNNEHRLANEVMNEWIDTKMVQDVVNENNDAMNHDQNRLVSKRMIDVKRKELNSALG